MTNPLNVAPIIARMHHFRSRARILPAFVLALLPLRTSATTVVPPDFDSLVSQADYIVRAVVKSKTAEWRAAGQNRNIITKVTLDVREIIKGLPPSPLVLEMLGGRIGQTELVVEGTPSFNVGDEDVLFVHGNGRQFFPLVAIMYGQYHVARDTASGKDFVHRSNGVALYDVKDISQPMTAAQAASSTAARPLTATEFATKIRLSVSLRALSPPANAN